MMMIAKFRTFLAVGAVLMIAAFLGGCPSTGDIRDQWLAGCTSYASVLEQLNYNHVLGVYTEEQWVQIQDIDKRTAPLCLKPTTYDANSLIMSALRELNTYLLMRGAQEQEN